MRKPSDKNRLMERLVEQGLPPAEIARRAEVSYRTAYELAVARRKKYPSYYDYLAEKKVESDPEFVKFLDGQPPSGRLYKTYAFQRQLKRMGLSHPEYRDSLAKGMAEKDPGYRRFLGERGTPPSQWTRKQYLLFREGTTDTKHKVTLARRKAKSDRYFKAFLRRENIQPSAATYGQYQAYQAAQRQQRLPNKIISMVITARLGALGRDQRWLAHYLGLTDAAVSRYAKGKTTPRGGLQPRLFEALELPYQTIDALVKDLTECPPAQLAGKLGSLGIAEGREGGEGLEGILDEGVGESPAALLEKIHSKAKKAAAESRQGAKAYSRQGAEPAPIDLLVGWLISAKSRAQKMTPEELARELGIPEMKLYAYIGGWLPSGKMQPLLFKALGLPYTAVGGIAEDIERYPLEALLEKWGLNDEATETITALKGLLGRLRGSAPY